MHSTKIESTYLYRYSTPLHQRLGSAYVKLEKRVTAGWRPRWDSFLRHVALVYLSKLDVDDVCRCLVLQIVISLSHDGKLRVTLRETNSQSPSK